MAPAPPEAASYPSFHNLLEAARNGDKDAQGRLLETCRRPLLWMARRKLNPTVQGKGSPSDVVQETFLKALREINSFQGCTPEQFLGWLRVILENTASNFGRRFRTGKRAVAREVSWTAGDGLRRAAPSAAETAIRHEQAGLLRCSLDRLPEHYREVVRLKSEEWLSFEEIGRRIGRSAEAARKLWVRAVARVGQEMARPPAALSDTPSR